MRKYNYIGELFSAETSKNVSVSRLKMLWEQNTMPQTNLTVDKTYAVCACTKKLAHNALV
jgi:hypothetical protein